MMSCFIKLSMKSESGTRRRQVKGRGPKLGADKAAPRAPYPHVPPLRLVQEMPQAGQHHDQSQFISGVDGVLIAHAATGLNDRPDASRRRRTYRIVKRKNASAGQYASLRLFTGLIQGNFDRANAVHLPGTNAQGGAIAGDDDRV